MVYAENDIINKICKNIQEILNYFLAALVILQMQNHMYSAMNDKILFFDTEDFQLLCLNILKVLTILYLFLTFFTERKSINVRKIFSLILTLLYLLLFTRLNEYNKDKMYDNFIIPFILLFVIFSMGDLEDKIIGFFKAFANIIFVIAVISIFFYFFGAILNLIKGKEILLYYGWAKKGRSYFNLYFINYSQNRPFLGLNVVRNIGIYVEAPGFAFGLTMALWWEIFGKKKINHIRCLIILITMITTFSMKAYLMIVIISFLYFVEYIKNKVELSREWILKLKIIMFFSTLFLIIIISLNIDFFKHMGSVSVRLKQTFAAIKTFLDYPLLGCGYDNRKEIIKNIFASDKGLTAGLFNVFAYGGIYLGTFYVLPLFYPFFSKTMNMKHISLFGIITVFLLMTSFHFSYFIILCLCMGYISICEERFITMKYKVKIKPCINISEL